jgi:hypothetical protein
MGNIVILQLQQRKNTHGFLTRTQDVLHGVPRAEVELERFDYVDGFKPVRLVVLGVVDVVTMLIRFIHLSARHSPR